MNHLVIMAKAPFAGRVKTRLAKEIGTSEAVRVYRVLFQNALRELACDPRWQTWVAVSPDVSIADHYWPRNVNLISQGRGNLGDRMQGLFDTLPKGPAIIIGSDIPGVRRAMIADGFAMFGSSQAVIGPAPDGGYWLVGQKRVPRVFRIFQNVRWSTRFACEDTLANLHGVSVAHLPELADLDTRADYLLWRKHSAK